MPKCHHSTFIERNVNIVDMMFRLQFSCAELIILSATTCNLYRKNYQNDFALSAHHSIPRNLNVYDSFA